ncbi:MAG TPA: hypothetical protein VNO14_13945 [Blastocatellia bacterium]|nr:hypothetical protein [Blastocatellia bacterium]
MNRTKASTELAPATDRRRLPATFKEMGLHRQARLPPPPTAGGYLRGNRL